MLVGVEAESYRGSGKPQLATASSPALVRGDGVEVVAAGRKMGMKGFVCVLCVWVGVRSCAKRVCVARKEGRSPCSGGSDLGGQGERRDMGEG